MCILLREAHYAEQVRLGCLSTKLTTDGRLGFSKDPDKHSTIRWTHCVQTYIEHSFFISYLILTHLYYSRAFSSLWVLCNIALHRCHNCLELMSSPVILAGDMTTGCTAHRTAPAYNCSYLRRSEPGTNICTETPSSGDGRQKMEKMEDNTTQWLSSSSHRPPAPAPAGRLASPAAPNWSRYRSKINWMKDTNIIWCPHYKSYHDVAYFLSSSDQDVFSSVIGDQHHNRWSKI